VANAWQLQFSPCFLPFAPMACARSHAPLHRTVGQDRVHLQLLRAVVENVEIDADAALRAVPLILLDVSGSGRCPAQLRLAGHGPVTQPELGNIA
jgi:hypothetical protein